MAKTKCDWGVDGGCKGKIRQRSISGAIKVMICDKHWQENEDEVKAIKAEQDIKAIKNDANPTPLQKIQQPMLIMERFGVK